jgi:hypothetical protein
MMFESLDAIRSAFQVAPIKKSIGRKLEKAEEGDIVRPGPHSYFTPVFINKPLTITVDPSDQHAVLAGLEGQPSIEILNNRGEVVLERLVLRDGGADMGAIAVHSDDATIVLRDCILFDNGCFEDYPAGGAMTVRRGRLHLERCIFFGNRGTRGGALRVGGFARLEAYACLFVENQAMTGGAVTVDEDGQARFVNCTFVDNACKAGSDGQTIHVAAGPASRAHVDMVNCVVRGPDRTFGYTEWAGGTITAENCVLPEDSPSYEPLQADPGTTFGEAAFAGGGFPYALPMDAAMSAPGSGDVFGSVQVVDVFGLPLREGDMMFRGAVRPREE